jgi:hypothetical protein
MMRRRNGLQPSALGTACKSVEKDKGRDIVESATISGGSLFASGLSMATIIDEAPSIPLRLTADTLCASAVFHRIRQGVMGGTKDSALSFAADIFYRRRTKLFFERYIMSWMQ